MLSDGNDQFRAALEGNTRFSASFFLSFLLSDFLTFFLSFLLSFSPSSRFCALQVGCPAEISACAPEDEASEGDSAEASRHSTGRGRAGVCSAGVGLVFKKERKKEEIQ